MNCVSTTSSRLRCWDGVELGFGLGLLGLG